MELNKKYMLRCIELAKKGSGSVAPNPMVGAVIVHRGCVIGEGYHERYGGPHAEINAINAVGNKELLSDSTMYVSLEPCSHHGKTPPCTLAIMQNKIPRVVIGHRDPFPKVGGSGIEQLLNAGVEVVTDFLYDECNELNKRFFTFHEKKRPFIILKWAESADGFIGKKRTSENDERVMLSTDETMRLVHQLRAKEAAILVGTNTALQDNPSLTVRLAEGRNPVRLVLDRDLKTPHNYHLYDKEVRTIFYTKKEAASFDNLEYVHLDFTKPVLPQILSQLYHESLISLLVEGGSALLSEFIKANLWDEARIETATNVILGKGVEAPVFGRGNPCCEKRYGHNQIRYYKNVKS